jgi:hypothetical protein
VQLDQREWIELARGKTNRQYARELSQTHPDLLPIFRKSIRLFEDAFFGKLPVSPEDFLEVWKSQNDFRPPKELRRR